MWASQNLPAPVLDAFAGTIDAMQEFRTLRLPGFKTVEALFADLKADD